MSGEPTPAAARCRSERAVTVGRMSFLAAAASSDQGGITGFLLDMVERLGAVGVGFAILLETVVPPIPSEAVLGLAGVLINDGRLDVVPVVLFATLGSILGAVFFYYVGRALGPRRSHAFLDRLPLVETEDVDKTFAWFERHGRSAVFFGRMVPIVRSFISVPAGVVRMPFAQFVVYSAAGSLIWNSVLIGLGVAAGDFVQANLKYLDYAVVAAFALGIGYLVHKRYRDVRRHRQARRAGSDESRSA
jgi:membrane protein DedA with SNARE-associated domain